MRPSRRGQASVEYMLLLCTMVSVACIVGYFLKDYTETLVDRIGERLLDAVITIAFG